MEQIPQPIVKAEPEPEFAALVAIDWADQSKRPKITRTDRGWVTFHGACIN